MEEVGATGLASLSRVLQLIHRVKRPMTVTLNKQQSRERIAEIRRLWNEWDPIGAASDSNDDEYDAYLAPTLRLLERGASDGEVVEFLSYVVHDRMGLSQMPSPPHEFVAKLKAWFSAKWAGTRVPGV